MALLACGGVMRGQSRVHECERLFQPSGGSGDEHGKGVFRTDPDTFRGQRRVQEIEAGGHLSTSVQSQSGQGKTRVWKPHSHIAASESG